MEPETASEEAAYGKWLDQTADREGARMDRIHGAVGVIPTPLWIALIFISVVIFVFILFFADRGEHAVTQALLMGSVIAVIVAMLLLLQFLDNPFGAASAPCSRWLGRGRLDIVNQAISAANLSERSPVTRAGSRASVSESAGHHWVEIGATLLLAVAAVATAWSSYQANRWNGEQAKAASRTNAIRFEATREAAQGGYRDRGRRGHVHPVGGRAGERRDRARSLLPARSRGVQAGVRGVDRHPAARERRTRR